MDSAREFSDAPTTKMRASVSSVLGNQIVELDPELWVVDDDYFVLNAAIAAM